MKHHVTSLWCLFLLTVIVLCLLPVYLCYLSSHFYFRKKKKVKLFSSTHFIFFFLSHSNYLLENKVKLVQEVQKHSHSAQCGCVVSLCLRANELWEALWPTRSSASRGHTIRTPCSFPSRGSTAVPSIPWDFLMKSFSLFLSGCFQCGHAFTSLWSLSVPTLVLLWKTNLLPVAMHRFVDQWCKQDLRLVEIALGIRNSQWYAASSLQY